MENIKGGVTLFIPRMLNATSGDRPFISKIANGQFNGFIHSVFKRTVNIYCLNDGELYTIASEQIDRAPNTLITQLGSFGDFDLKENDPVIVVNGSLRIAGKIAISIAKSTTWQCLMPDFPNDWQQLRVNIATARDFIEAHGTSGGMQKRLQMESPIDEAVKKLLDEHSQLLLKELQADDMEKAHGHAFRIIGLGQGLTPSGDDYLVGIFATFHLRNSPYQEYQAFCLNLVTAAENLTNAISYMALKKAAQGQVRESIVQFLHALIYGNSEDMILKLKPVLSIGSTSGTDLALGLLAGMELNMLKKLEVRYVDENCY